MLARRQAATVVVVVLALIWGGVVAAVPAQAATGFSFMQLSGEPDDGIIGKRTYFLTPPDSFVDARLSASAATVSTLRRDNSHRFDVSMRSPVGEELVLGRTYTAVKDTFRATPQEPALFLSGDGAGCGDSRGSFTILELEKDAATGDVTRFAAAFEVRCGGRTGSSRGTVAWNASRSPVVAVSTTPATAVLDGPVALSGTLQDAAGPFAGATVDVTRPGGSGGTVLLSATTDADGAFSVQDVIGAVPRTWTVAFAGDDAHDAASRVVTVSPVKAASTLTLAAPTTPVKRGATYTVHGSLLGGGAPLVGTTVTLKRTSLAGTRTVFVKTDASGNYKVGETAVVGGPVTWRASWPGTSHYETPAAVTRSVTVDRAATSVSITTDRTRYAYGARAKLTVRLGTTYNSRLVSVFAYKAGKTSFIAQGTVARGGALVLSVPVTANTRYTVKFVGDYRYRPATDSSTVASGSRLTVSVPKAIGRSGSTYILGSGSSYNVIADILPVREGACANLVVQRLSGSGWVTTRTVNCEPIGSPSRVWGIVYRVETPGTGRIMFSVPADKIAGAVASPWVYFRFS